MIYSYCFFFVIAQWTLPNIILIRDIDMFSTYVPISANCLFVYCLLHLCIRMCIGFFVCNINHCNDSAPCWDLDWTIKSYLILSYLILSYTNQGGTYKVRNEIETKRNEAKRNQ